MTLDSPSKAADKHTARSRVTNGSEVLPGVDGRTLWVRRLRDLIELYVGDLGGADNTSEAERSILRRAATLTVELERMEKMFATQGEASAEALDVYSRVAANLRRMLEATGLRRRTRDVTPTLDQYLGSV